MTTTATNLKVFGDPVDEGALRQIEEVLKHPLAVQGALMADPYLMVYC